MIIMSILPPLDLNPHWELGRTSIARNCRRSWIRQAKSLTQHPTSTCHTSPTNPSSLYKVNWVAFNQDLHQNLAAFTIGDDLDSAVATWYHLLMNVLDKHAPLTMKRKKARRHCPWLTAELVQLVRQRNALHKRLVRDPGNAALREQHQEARTAGRRLDPQLKSRHFQTQCSTSRPHKLWSVINTVIGRGKSCRKPLAPIGATSTIFGQVVSDPLRPDTLPVPLGPINATDFGVFEAVTLQDVQKLLRQVNPRKATGSDSVPGLVLREAAYVLAPSLLDIFNVSLSTGHVPAAFKKSNVALLYKSGDPCRATNYRPVSLLPIVSRLLEKAVQAQYTSYLNIRNLFPGTQFAYRNNHSTEDALVYAVNRWQEAKQKGQTMGIVMVDMPKAFDRVGHSKLIAILHSLGILGTTLAWFCSYLSCRVQSIKIGLKVSSEVKCTWGGGYHKEVYWVLYFLLSIPVASTTTQHLSSGIC